MTEPCEWLPWDSTFFGERIARVVPTRLTPSLGSDVLAWCDDHQIDCAYFLADCSDQATLRLAPRLGFDLVDVRVALQADLNARVRVPTAPPGLLVRPVTSGDVTALKDIARSGHHDSRFYVDGRFDRSRCDELFALWIEKSCNGFADVVFVAEASGAPAGYVTGHLTGDRSGKVGLVAVDASARGQGCGRALIAAIGDWFASRSVSELDVVTQGRNAPALGFYQRSGFRVAGVSLWYHRWRAGASER